MIIPKFFNTWLSVEEEEKLKIPSRRVFCIGALSTLCLTAAPDGFKRLGNLFVPDDRIWRPGMRLNWMGEPNMPRGLMEALIEDMKVANMYLTEVSRESFRHRWTVNRFDPTGEQHILTIETCIPELGAPDDEIIRKTSG